MTDPRYRRINRLAEAALAFGPEERSAYLDERCGSDEGLRTEVEELLAVAEAAEGDSSLEDPRPMDRSGEQIGSWKLVRELGRGGMGVVYLARRADGTYSQEAAVKLLDPMGGAADLHRRLVAERQILADLAHPNIARLLDGGTTDEGTPYLVLERVDGLPIDRYCDQHRLSLRRRLELFQEICAAVDHAHRRLIVHRDLKPSNILVEDGGAVKLLDFGIAKLLDPQRSSSSLQLTEAWGRRLSPSYASLEQLRGDAITTATDVYSLGVVLYQLLTGELPHRLDGLSPARMEQVLARSEVQAPSLTLTAEAAERRGGEPAVLCRELAGDLDAIVLKALRPEPEERYESPRQLADDLRSYLEGFPVAARRGTLRYRAGKLVRRHFWSVTAGLLALVAVLGFTLITLWQNRRIEAERQQAVEQRDLAQRQSETTERLSQVLWDVFEVADPGGAGARNLTARDLLDQARPRIEEELASEPELRARALARLGGIYRNLEDYPVAEELLLEALELHRAQSEPRPLELAGILSDLGLLRHLQGRYGKCIELFEEALELRRSAAEPRSEPVAQGLYFVAYGRQATGEFELAAEAARESLAIRRQLQPLDPVKMAQSLDQVGSVEIGLGELASAGVHFEEALRLRQQQLGADHALVAESLSNLGSVQSRLGDHAAAARSLRRAWEINRQALGDASPITINIQGNLAAALVELGELEEAAPLVQEVLAHRRATLPAGHPWIAHGYLLQGRLHYRQQDYDRAAASYREALAQCPSSGQRHPLCGFPALGLVKIDHDRGRRSQALERVQALLEEWRELVPEGHRILREGEALRAELLGEGG